MKRIAWSLVAIGFSFMALAAPDDSNPAETGTASDTKAAIEEAGPGKPWALTGGFDYLTQYIFRGYNTVPSGLIIQPYLDFAYTVYDENGFSITPHIGVWADFTEKSGPREWDKFAEGDVTGGIAFDYQHFNLTINYNYQGYPSKYAPGGGEISEVQEMQCLLVYDDSHWFETIPLLASTNPHITYVQEIKDRNDHNNDKYLEIGIEPTFEEFNVVNLPVTISVPLTVGLSTDTYYKDADGHNEVVGYYLAGIKATVAIPVSEKWGTWSIVLECDYINLRAQSVIDANTGDRDDIVGRFGVQFEI